MPNGFSLIEILVAIAIISLVSVVAIPNFKNFSNVQELENTTSSLKDALRRAQSSANSSIDCSNGSKSTGWSVTLSSTGYSLIAACLNSSSEILSTSVWLKPVGLLDSSCGSALPISINFKGSLVTFLCNGTALPSQSFEIKLSNQSGISKTLTVFSSGVINEN